MWRAATILVLACCCGGARANHSTQEGWLAAGQVTYRAPLTELRYYEGQPVNFTCWRRPGSNHSVQLSYFSEETKAVSTYFRQHDFVEMYLKLRAAHNDTILSCKVRYDGPGEHLVRLRLLLGPAPRAAGLEVNGLRLAAHSDGHFEYRYMWKERMTVRLAPTPGARGIVVCDVTGDRFPGPWLDRLRTPRTEAEPLLVNASLEDAQSGTRLECSVAPYEGARKVRLTLDFIYYELDPFVGGLTMANVELLYKTNVTNVFYDIHTPDTGNDTLYFTCNPPGGGVSWWAWNTGELDANPDHFNESFPHAFRLFESATWSLLRCERQPPEDRPLLCVYLWLHRAPPPQALEAPPPRVGGPGATWVWAGTAALGLLLLGAGLAAGVVTCRRRRAPPMASVLDDHVYEYIPESGLLWGDKSVAASIAQRPQHPLPLEAQQQQERYKHYDTPYEWRIFRFGVAPRCACGRCSDHQ